MKITHISIEKHLQFKDFDLDLTYPKGHLKEGQPLDKVCIIGQSGTGKTTLLNLLYAFGELVEKEVRNRQSTLYFPIESDFKIAALDFYGEKKKEDITRLWSRYNNGEDYISSDLHLKGTDGSIKRVTSVPKEVFGYEKILQQNKLFFYITADILAQFSHLSNPIKEEKKLVGMVGEEDMELKQILETYHQEKMIKIDSTTDPNLWKYILKEIAAFDKKVTQKNQELFKKLASKDAEKVFKEFIAWKKEQANPRTELAEKLNEILTSFHLKVDPEEMEHYLTILTQNEEIIIPHHQLSTGTKQIILTTSLLWGAKLDNAVVLIDEPECSLYPDTQRKIVDFYTKIADTSQFFIATHSPIIAASFEPWEIIELVLEKDGSVKQEKYYEGERHINNYFTDFRYLRWDDILREGFGMTEEGNSEFRDKELMKIARLAKRLEKMREEGKGQTPEYEVSLSEYITSAKKVAWNYEKD